MTLVDVTFWGSFLIGSFKVFLHRVIFVWTEPWPQFIWLVDNWLYERCLSSLMSAHSCCVIATRFPISFIHSPRWGFSVGFWCDPDSFILSESSVISPYFPLYVPKCSMLLLSEISWVCVYNYSIKNIDYTHAKLQPGFIFGFRKKRACDKMKESYFPIYIFKKFFNFSLSDDVSEW